MFVTFPAKQSIPTSSSKNGYKIPKEEEEDKLLFFFIKLLEVLSTLTVSTAEKEFLKSQTLYCLSLLEANPVVSPKPELPNQMNLELLVPSWASACKTVLLVLGSTMNNFLSLVVAPSKEPCWFQSREVTPSAEEM